MQTSSVNRLFRDFSHKLLTVKLECPVVMLHLSIHLNIRVNFATVVDKSDPYEIMS